MELWQDGFFVLGCYKFVIVAEISKNVLEVIFFINIEFGRELIYGGFFFCLLI